MRGYRDHRETADYSVQAMRLGLAAATQRMAMNTIVIV